MSAMTEREMIEFAAKAAKFSSWDWLRGDGLMNVYDAEGRQSAWNPLTNDGDALRLAVKLGIGIEIDYDTKTANASWVDKRGNPSKLKDVMSKFFGDGDACKSSRSVIVRAAAEIGRTTAPE